MTQLCRILTASSSINWRPFESICSI